MIKIEDLVGKKFGKLTIVQDGGKRNGRLMIWCKCDCGNPELQLKGKSDVIHGKTTSCGCILRHDNIIGTQKENYQGCKMKVIKYKDYGNVEVEFIDDYHYITTATYERWKRGNIKNPYAPSIYKYGCIGTKYPIQDNNGNKLKEYVTWKFMIARSFDSKTKEKHPTYKDVTCCKEWLLYENFYEWIHSQDNFEQWFNGSRWQIDKDILIKGNKIYSPDTCCLVPYYINYLFTKNDADRGNYLIGVSKIKDRDGFRSMFHNPLLNKNEFIGYYYTEIDAFNVYKKRKEEVVKLIAKQEYNKGNITKKCYDAMMNYEVEITD